MKGLLTTQRHILPRTFHRQNTQSLNNLVVLSEEVFRQARAHTRETPPTQSD